MTTITIEADAWQVAGLAHATAAYNAAQPTVDEVEPTPLTEAEYAQQVFGSALTSYSRARSIITSAAFVLRFTPAEFAGIVAAAAVSPAVAGYLAEVTNSPTVNLRHEIVTGGLAAIEAAGLIAPGRAAQLVAP